MAETEDEDQVINDALRRIQPQYPSLSLEELRQIFNDTYDRCQKEFDDAVLNADVVV